MSDYYMKPGVHEGDADIDESNSFEEWFDNDPDGWVRAVFEEAMLIQAETKPVELAVLHILSSFQFSDPNSRLKHTWLDMFEFWSKNLDEQSEQQLEIYYQKWLGEQ